MVGGINRFTVHSVPFHKGEFNNAIFVFHTGGILNSIITVELRGFSVVIWAFILSKFVQLGLSNKPSELAILTRDLRL